MLGSPLVRGAVWIIGLTAFLPGQQIAAAAPPQLQIRVVDRSQQPLAGVQVVLSAAGSDQPTASHETNGRGEAVFERLADGDYIVQAVKPGFYPLPKALRVQGGVAQSLVFTLLATETQAQTVNVTANSDPESEATAEVAAAPPAAVSHDTLFDLPEPAPTATAALPLVPGVVRTTDGRIAVDGARNTESGVLINDADATDPATGEFNLSLPLDVVDEVRVYQAPYLGEYGGFTGGLTRIETRGGGDEWKYEYNDFVPEPRFRNDSIFGFRGAGPHVHISGPLLAHKLYFSEGFLYLMDKAPVRGLPFPEDLTTSEGEDSFTQLDWVPTGRDLVTATFNVAPQHQRYLGLDLFRPQPATPDISRKNFGGQITEHHALRGGAEWESDLQVNHFQTSLWPQSAAPMLLTPDTTTGGYFNAQQRHALRLAIEESYTAAPIHRWGTHAVKFGGGFARTDSIANFQAHAIEAFRPDGTLAESIGFGGGSGLTANDYTWAAYIQDQWLLRPGLTLDLSTRYASESIASAVHLAPRAGLAWNLRPSLVLRGGYGLFYERIPLNVAAFPAFPVRTVTLYDAAGATVDSVTTYPNVLTDFTLSPRKSKFLPGGDFNFLPYNITWNAEVEKHLGPNLLVTANYMGSHTMRQFEVNPAVDETGLAAMTLSNRGNTRFQKLQFTGRWTPGKNELLNLSYVRSKAMGDLNDFDSLLGDNAMPLILRNQYAPLPFDVPDRFLAWGDFHLPQSITFSPILDIHSGFPFSPLSPNWTYAAPADSLRFPRYTDLDFTLVKVTTLLGKYNVRWGCDLYNALNHYNPVDVQNHIGDPNYGLFLANQIRYFVPELDLLF